MDGMVDEDMKMRFDANDTLYTTYLYRQILTELINL